MRVAALLLAGGAMIVAAQAQSEGTRVRFPPMSNTLPLLLFAPESLAGAMLEPLAEPKAPAPVEDFIAAPAEAAADAHLLSEDMAQVGPDPVEEDAAATPEADAEDQPAGAEAPPDTAVNANASTVHVIVENVESSSGTVNVAVCDTDFTPEGCPYKVSVPATAGFVEAKFEDVPPGSYAVVGYHDVNNNDEFDKFLGMPREPYALSGQAAEELVPAFRDAILKINLGENYVIIRMKRMGSG